MSFRHIVLAMVTYSVTSAAFGQVFQTWSVDDGGSGHQYAVVSGQVSWTTARRRATQLGGYLATVTSREENQFILDIADDDNYWNKGVTREVGPWIGGFQNSAAREPDKDWQWVTGETFSYAPWAIEQPDDFRGIEDYIQFVNVDGRPSGRWNDQRNVGGAVTPSVSFVVEKEPPERLRGRTSIGFNGLDLTTIAGTNEVVSAVFSEEIECKADWVLRTPNVEPSAIRRDVYSFDCSGFEAVFSLGPFEATAKLVSNPILAEIDVRANEDGGARRVTSTFDLILESLLFEPATVDLRVDFALEEESLKIVDVHVENADEGVQLRRIGIEDEPEWLATDVYIAGDVEGNGAVEFKDFLILSANFGREEAEISWRDGDFNNDQLVGFTDFLLLSKSFGELARTESVPEPTSALWTILLLTFYFNRRTKRSARLAHRTR